jgi:hypothetical protein
MPRIGKGQRKLDAAHEFRDKLERLLAETPHRRWLRGWFIDWAESELRRNRFYVYTDKERAVLHRQLSRLRPVSSFGDYAISELISMAATYRADCDEDDGELLSTLLREKPSQVPLWLALRLVSICRHIAGVPIPYIEDLETVVADAAAA